MRLRPLIVFLLAALPAWIASSSTAKGPAASRALVISIDGLRPDVLMDADAPVLDALMGRGCYSLRARTTPLCNTLPSHTSMLTGVAVPDHGVDWNRDLPAGQRRYPLRPTLFEVARGAGLTTAMVVGKSKFKALEKPATLNWSYVLSAGDQVVTDTAVRLIETHAPQVLFVHLPGVDRSGHFWGWGSGRQRAAVAGADRSVGRLLDALRRRGVLDSTVVVVSSDHGGAGRGHGAGDPLSRNIPWIVSGPGVRERVDLDRDASLEIETEDTFATVCGLLGIAPSQPIKGRMVEAILER